MDVGETKTLIKCLCNSECCSGYMGISKETFKTFLKNNEYSSEEQFKKDQMMKINTLEKKQVQRCSNCQQIGHNKRRCNVLGFTAQSKKKKRKKKKDPEKRKIWNKNYRDKVIRLGKKRKSRALYMKEYRIKKVIKKYIDDIYLAAEYTQSSSSESESEGSQALDQRPVFKFEMCTDKIIQDFKLK